jgi:hypothetical protein
MRPVSFTTVTERLLGVGGVFEEADWVARRAFRGVVVVMAERKPARKTKRDEVNRSGDSLAAMIPSIVLSVRTIGPNVVLNEMDAIEQWLLDSSRASASSRTM